MNYAKTYERWKSLMAQKADLNRQFDQVEREITERARRVFFIQNGEYRRDGHLKFIIGDLGVEVRGTMEHYSGNDHDHQFIPLRYMEAEDPAALMKLDAQQAADAEEYQQFLRLKEKYEG